MNAWGEYNRLLVRTTWKKSFPFAKFYRDSLSGKSTAAWLIMRRWYWSRKLREVCQKGADFTDHLQPQNLVYFRSWLLLLYDYHKTRKSRHERSWTILKVDRRLGPRKNVLTCAAQRALWLADATKTVNQPNSNFEMWSLQLQRTRSIVFVKTSRNFDRQVFLPSYFI